MQESQPQLTLLGEEFLSRLPESIVKAALQVPTEWLSLSEHELKKVCYPAGSTQLEHNYQMDEQIRFQFWEEHKHACETNTRVQLNRICAGIMQPPNFSQKFLKEPKRVAWMLCPRGSYLAEVAHVVKTGTQRMLEIMELPSERRICRCHWGCMCPKKVKEFQAWQCSCKNGCICPAVFDHKLMDVKFKIYQNFEMRLKGSIPQVVSQRIQSVNYNVNKNLPSSPTDKPLLECSEAELDAQLAKLRAETAASRTALPPSRDIAPFINATVLTVDDGKSNQLEKELVPLPDTGDNS